MAASSPAPEPLPAAPPAATPGRRVGSSRGERTFDRAENLRRLRAEEFDVLVIGGGITGAGVALDAAARGLRTALVDAGDFASGTSSKSSKLVHGGLRYLQGGDVRLVYEALRERQRLLRNASHLVSVMPFLIPMFADNGVIHPKLARALGSAMWMYDLVGGARIGKLHRRISARRTLEHMPTLPPERVAASYLYYDAAADDARLTLAVARTAADSGAACANHLPVVRLVVTGSGGHRSVCGAVVRDRLAPVGSDGAEFTISARAVVNATGVWADRIPSLPRTASGSDDPSEAPTTAPGAGHRTTIRPAKGVHLTVPWELVRNTVAVVAPVPGDRRSVFVVPWPAPPGSDPAYTYIGTTDTDYDGPLDDPECTEDDVDYLLRAINHSTTTTITRADVVGTWAGLRPLISDDGPGDEGASDAGGSARTADLSRTHRVTVSDDGVVSVTGGKLTTYRAMAQDTVDRVADALDLPRRQRRSRTARRRLHGAPRRRRSSVWSGAGDPQGPSAQLRSRYGTRAAALEDRIAADPTLGEPLVAGLPYLAVEAVWAVEEEMACTLWDVVARRTRAVLLARDDVAAAAPAIAALIGERVGWDADRCRREADDVVERCRREAMATHPGRSTEPASPPRDGATGPS